MLGYSTMSNSTICSLVATNGPVLSTTLPSRTRTVTAVDGGASGWPSSRTWRYDIGQPGVDGTGYLTGPSRIRRISKDEVEELHGSPILRAFRRTLGDTLKGDNWVNQWRRVRR